MKKSFKILLAGIFLITYNSANSQETKSSELTSKVITANPYEARYTKLKELYIKMLDSESSKKVDGMLQIYLEKSNYKKYKDEIKDYSRIDEWIAQNVAKTRFKSREEAETEWQIIVTPHEKVSIENKEYEEYLIDTIMRDYGKQLFADIVVDVVTTYPEKFGLPIDKFFRN